METTGEPVAIESDGRTVTVIVSVEDFALLQRLREAEDDRIDVAALKDARSELGSTPWEKIKAALGLGTVAVPDRMEAVGCAGVPEVTSTNSGPHSVEH